MKNKKGSKGNGGMTLLFLILLGAGFYFFVYNSSQTETNEVTYEGSPIEDETFALVSNSVIEYSCSDAVHFQELNEHKDIYGFARLSKAIYPQIKYTNTVSYNYCINKNTLKQYYCSKFSSSVGGGMVKSVKTNCDNCQNTYKYTQGKRIKVGRCIN